jgi:hypothetical protein
LLIYPRTGPDGAPASTPSQTIPLTYPAEGLAMSDHVLAVRYHNTTAVLDNIDLYGLDPATNTWSVSSTVPRGWDTTQSISFAVSDQAIVIGSSTNPGSTIDGHVLVIPLTISGASVGWTLGNVVGLGPDPTWTSADRLGFGRVVAIDGDWVAASAGQDHAVVYRHTAPTWTPDLTITNPNAPGSDGRFATSLAIDTSSAAGPRVLVGTQGGFAGSVPTAGRVDLYASGPTGWTLQHTFNPRAGSALGGFAEGIVVALDGSRAVIGYYWGQVPGVGAQAEVDDQRLEVWNLGTTPIFEKELSVLSAEGGPKAGETSSAPAFLSIAGSHIVATASDSYTGNVVHYSAVSFDRHPSS